MLRRCLLVLALLVAATGCLGGPSGDANHVVIDNRRGDPVTVRVVVTQNGTEAYNRTHTVTDRTELEDVVELGPEYSVRASVPGGPSDSQEWNTGTACGHLNVYVDENDLSLAVGPC